MKNNFIIRKATVKDLKGVLRLSLELFRKEYREFDKTLDPNWLLREGAKFFRKRITKRNSFVEVVEHEKRIVGYLAGGITKRAPARRKLKYADLGSIFIEKKFRNKGLGRILVRDFINWCRKNNVNYVSVKPSAKNKVGVNFYRKCGFEDLELKLAIKLK